LSKQQLNVPTHNHQQEATMKVMKGGEKENHADVSPKQINES